ncbi:MAG: nickel pincer cofactor biosynthesis protein LarB [Candidatus Cloacimonetes bacterium]|nr:nickel pincer cofactor biosynthesis protein LarB [Candidatus Cloacimonadota bacterium]
MNKDYWLSLFNQIKKEEVGSEQFLEMVRDYPYSDLAHTKLDTHRSLFRNHAEVIYGEGKSARQIVDIVLHQKKLAETSYLITRVSRDKAESILELMPELIFDPDAAILFKAKDNINGPEVPILTGGTADYSVAKEAAITLSYLGCTPKIYADVGVFGLHRLLAIRENLLRTRVAIVIAGMEAALASVAAGLIPGLVIGVPTSVGYGSGAGGKSALLSMLNSCAPNLAVVNIDSGFKAAYLAAIAIGEKFNETTS